MCTTVKSHKGNTQAMVTTGDQGRHSTLTHKGHRTGLPCTHHTPVTCITSHHTMAVTYTSLLVALYTRRSLHRTVAPWLPYRGVGAKGQIQQGQPRPPWHQLPWSSRRDTPSRMHSKMTQSGQNTSPVHSDNQAAANLPRTWGSQLWDHSQSGLWLPW